MTMEVIPSSPETPSLLMDYEAAGSKEFPPPGLPPAQDQGAVPEDESPAAVDVIPVLLR